MDDETMRAALAAASPETLLRAALTEEELHALAGTDASRLRSRDPYGEHYESAVAKAARALRGGEET